MASVLGNTPTSAYVLAQWAVQFAIENPETFYPFFTENSKIQDGITNPGDLVEDLEITKTLLHGIGEMSEELFKNPARIIAHNLLETGMRKADLIAQGSDIGEPNYSDYDPEHDEGTSYCTGIPGKCPIHDN